MEQEHKGSEYDALMDGRLIIICLCSVVHYILGCPLFCSRAVVKVGNLWLIAFIYKQTSSGSSFLRLCSPSHIYLCDYGVFFFF